MSDFAPTWLTLILQASLLASLLAILVLGLQLILRRHVPARWRFILWLLVLVRFMPLPLPQSRLSLFNWLPQAPAVAAVKIPKATPAPVAPVINDSEPILRGEPQADPPPAIANPITTPTISLTPSASPLPSTPSAIPPAAAPTSPSAPATTPTPPPHNPWPTLLAILYLTGAAIIFIRFTLTTLALRRIIRRAQPATLTQNPSLFILLDAARFTLRIRRPIPILLTDSLAGPALVGYFHPRLLLPRDLLPLLSPEELRLIFLHECAHLRRRDILLNYLLAALAMLHWFNPLYWLLLPHIRADRELACDELVLLHTADPAPYGRTLLKLLESTPSPAARVFTPAVGIVESRSYFARRIHMIAAFRKTPSWLAIPALLTLAIAAACTLTGPLTRAADDPFQTVRPAAVGIAREIPADAAVGVAGEKPNADAAGAADPFQPPDANAKTLIKLGENLKEVHADSQSLVKILDFLRDNLGCNIAVNWTALEARGIDRNTPVSINLTDVPARKVLRTVLDGVGGGVGIVDYVVEDGVITITCGEDLAALQRRVQMAGGSGGRANAATANAFLEMQRNAPVRQAAIADPRNAMAQEQISTLHELETVRMNLERELVAVQVGGGGTAAKDIDKLKAQLDKVNEQIDMTRQQIELTQKRFAEAAAAQPDAVLVKTPAVPAKPGRTGVYDVHDLLDVPDAQQGPLTSDQRNAMLDLVKTITTMVQDPNYTISSFNGTLVIAATDDVHNQIQTLLRDLELSHAERKDKLKARAAENKHIDITPPGGIR